MALRDRANRGKRVSVSEIRKRINNQHRNMGKVVGPGHSTREVPDLDCQPGEFMCRVPSNPNIETQDDNQWYQWKCCSKRDQGHRPYKKGGKVRGRRR